MSVMMHAFYGDSSKRDHREHDWWNFAAEKIEDLGKPGFNATFMGYDPYDYFDLGDYDQKGGTRGCFSSASRCHDDVPSR